jgi:hypothetical protein
MSDANRDTEQHGAAQPARQTNTFLWIALLLFGVAGLSVNALMRPDGRAQRFAVVTTVERVLVEEVPTEKPADESPAPAPADTSEPAPDTDASAVPATTDGKPGPSEPKRAWVAPDDPRLASGALRRVEGMNPISWETRETVKPAEAELRKTDIKDGGPVRIESSLVDSIGVWIAALFTLFILSFVYRDNPFYKVAESVLIGVSAAYWMVIGVWSSIVPDLLGALAPDLVRAYAMPSLPVSETPALDAALACVPLALGFMLLWRLAPKGGWIAVWPIAFVIGTTAGLRLVGSVEADLMRQVEKTMKPLVVFEEGVAASGEAIRLEGFWGTVGSAVGRIVDFFGAIDFWGTVGSAVGVIGVLSVLTYFFFSVDHKGAVGRTARVGIWFLMISFGSAFGLTVMGRITLLLQRFEFLFTDWLGIS